MFYSRAFLAKKGPLATVWMAAHLESRLRKSHLKKADIHSFIDTIMFPEVPIALRLSGHLLLGVVRIYSKKVDYLYHDCNEFASQIIRTFFAPAPIDLPEDKAAAFNSVTLPETFDLDAFYIDDAVDLSKSSDGHVKPLEFITLQDQVPPEGIATYIPFYLSEDSTDSSSSSGRPSLGAVPMGEVTLPPFPAEIATNLEGFVGIATSPDFGVMLDADPRLEVGIPEHDVVGVGDGGKPHQHEDANDGDARMEDVFHGDDRLPVLPESPPSLDRKKFPGSASANVIPINDVVDSLGQRPIPEVELQPSPPVRVQKATKRKRGNLFEEKIVLTNAEIKKQLNDPKKLKSKRRKLPCSTLDLWRCQGRVHLEKTFEVPPLSGLSYKLKQFCQNRYTAPVAKTPHADPCEDIGAISPIEHPRFDVPTYENLFGTMGAAPASSPVEQMQNFTSCTSENLLETARTDNPVSPPEQLGLDSLSEPHLSQGGIPLSEIETTPFLPTDQVSVSQGGRTMESAVPWTANTDHMESGMPWTANTDHMESGIMPWTATTDRIESGASHLGTPQDDHRHQMEFGMHLSEIGSASRSPASDDLNFLEEECTVQGSERSAMSAARTGFSIKTEMSARTKAVAHYFKEHSPGDSVVNKSGALSLNKILEGKKRKHCARMFFETLVLKDSNYIDVHQQDAYGDVTVYLTPALSEILL